MLCCLCREPVPSNRRKRKKLHGEACTLARSVLRKFTFVSLERLVETRDPDAVLCYLCENKLTRIHDLEIKLNEARSTIERMSGCLQASSDDPPPKVARFSCEHPLGHSSQQPPSSEHPLGPLSSSEQPLGPPSSEQQPLGPPSPSEQPLGPLSSSEQPLGHSSSQQPPKCPSSEQPLGPLSSSEQPPFSRQPPGHSSFQQPLGPLSSSWQPAESPPSQAQQPLPSLPWQPPGPPSSQQPLGPQEPLGSLTSQQPSRPPSSQQLSRPTERLSSSQQPVGLPSTTGQMSSAQASAGSSQSPSLGNSSQESTVSPAIEVCIPYQSGPRKFFISTPSRKKSIKRLTRKTYVSMASSVVNSPTLSRAIVPKMAAKIKSEMKELSSDAHDSILRDTVEAVKNFSWETVKLELTRKVPTLMTLLSEIVGKPSEHIPVICFIASQLLKCNHQRLCLVQRAISVMLYGHGTSKQVFSNLQPLHVCLSHEGTMNIIRSISQDHDVEVQMWCDELTPLIDVPTVLSSAAVPSAVLPMAQLDDFDSDDSSNVSESIDSPAFSPISPVPVSPPADATSDVASPVNEDQTSAMDTDHDVPVPDDHRMNDWYGFKFVGDNVDGRVTPSFQRAEIRGHDMHYFHGCGVRDRVDLSAFSDKPPPYSTPDANVILPSSEDVEALQKELGILVSRTLLQHCDEFANQSKDVPKHIESRYSKEMASKSETIPLGVLLLNENKLEEMSQILGVYMKYVPTHSCTGHHVLPNGSVLDFDDTRFFPILFGGDMLTSARIRGTQALRSTEDRAVERLEGIVPVTEDWHSRMTLMKAIWGRLYNTKSTRERGTMYQLRNLIARNVVPHDPEKNMNAAEDFMLLLLHSHVVAAARVLQLENPTTSLKTLANRVISRFVRLPNLSDQATADCTDGVYSYAVEVLSMGLLWHGFHDAIKEGDGERILRYWKFLLVIFKSTRHKNYAKESVILLHQYYYQLSDRQKMQLLWSRCVNTQGRQGCNIPCDLYMEHLNRRFKTVLRGMGSSITLARVRRAGQSIQFVHKVCETFEKQTAKRQHSDHHPYPSFGKDFQTVIKVLLEENVFTEVQVRQHSTFKFRKGLIEALSRKELAAKVNTSLKQL